jgi:ribosome biogenesis GTPase
MSLDLVEYGWNETLASAFQVHGEAGLIPGRVTLEHTHIYRVVTRDGEVLARVAGRLRHHAGTRADFPAVGDWVALQPVPHGSDARILAVLPRTSRFSRRAAGDVTAEQVVAANVDTVLLVAGLDGNFNPRRIERYLLVAWESGAAPVIVLNKSDLCGTVAARIEEVRALAPAVPVYAVSCRDPQSLEPLRTHLGRGHTGAMLGSSGAGKSTIVNTLVGEDVLPTRDVRESDSRGRHTSTSRQMVVLPGGGGLLIDTPGMRELQLWDAGGLTGSFTDITDLAGACRFRDCRHTGEPGCAVAAAVAAGTLPAARLGSYLKLAAEQGFAARQQDERERLEAKRRARVAGKALAKRLKERDQS